MCWFAGIIFALACGVLVLLNIVQGVGIVAALSLGGGIGFFGLMLVFMGMCEYSDNRVHRLIDEQ